MVNPDTVVDLLVTQLRSISALATTLFATNEIVGYKYDFPRAQDFIGFYEKADPPVLLVYHRGCRTGNIAAGVRIAHEISLVWKRNGNAGEVFAAVREGVPGGTGLKWKLRQLSSDFLPPYQITFGYRPMETAARTIIDVPEMQFILAERGIDN